MAKFILGITGASGAIYALRTAMYLKRCGHIVCALITDVGRTVVHYEGADSLYDYCDETPNINDFLAPCASGSAHYMGMAVVPCSMGTLGRIAAGTSDNLLVRAADVCLKEKRPLILAPREMPFNLIHLENMERVHRAGATIIPPSPHFYNKPNSIEELVDTVVSKILIHLRALKDGKEIIPSWNGMGEKATLGGSLC